MANRKSKAQKGLPQSQKGANSDDSNLQSLEQGFFPFARYTSVVGVHTTLLAFTALFLPQTPFFFELTKPTTDRSQLTSRDRPQHPFLEALTISPVSTLASVCAGAIVLQAWWGGWIRNWWIEFSLDGSSDENLLRKNVLNKQKFTNIRNAWLATFVTSFAIHVVLVLFGAPLISHALHTYLLALLVSVLIVFTPAYTLGSPSFARDTASLVNRMNWVRLFAEFSLRTPIERAMVYPAVGTALGCWVGVFPIALDWDRPWQAWPLTPALGAIVGYIIGSISALAASATRSLADEHMRSQYSHLTKRKTG